MRAQRHWSWSWHMCRTVQHRQARGRGMPTITTMTSAVAGISNYLLENIHAFIHTPGTPRLTAGWCCCVAVCMVPTQAEERLHGLEADYGALLTELQAFKEGMLAAHTASNSSASSGSSSAAARRRQAQQQQQHPHAGLDLGFGHAPCQPLGGGGRGRDDEAEQPRCGLRVIGHEHQLISYIYFIDLLRTVRMTGLQYLLYSPRSAWTKPCTLRMPFHLRHAMFTLCRPPPFQLHGQGYQQPHALVPLSPSPTLCMGESLFELSSVHSDASPSPSSTSMAGEISFAGGIPAVMAPPREPQFSTAESRLAQPGGQPTQTQPTSSKQQQHHHLQGVAAVGSGSGSAPAAAHLEQVELPAPGEPTCLRCGLNDRVRPGGCSFHPALLEQPGPLLHTPEWTRCKAAGHTAAHPGCHSRQEHYYSIEDRLRMQQPRMAPQHQQQTQQQHQVLPLQAKAAAAAAASMGAMMRRLSPRKGGAMHAPPSPGGPSSPAPRPRIALPLPTRCS